jgi:ABC-type phosphate transport system auxiliary subunit
MCLNIMGYNTDIHDLRLMLDNVHHLLPGINGGYHVQRRVSVIEEETRAILHKQEQTIRDLKHELLSYKQPEPSEVLQGKLLDEKKKEIELLKSQLQQ